MTKIGYTAVERFGPENGDAWTKYKEWSGLAQLSQVISLDGSLCPAIIRDRVEEDWKHVICEDYMTDYFHDLEYLLRRLPQGRECNIIGFVREPDSPFPHHFENVAADFLGYDLYSTGISSLLNCGGFPDCFNNAELNQFGLIPNYERAQEVRNLLRQRHPEEPHAECELWALWIIKKRML